jgi:hypothetical protein
MYHWYSSTIIWSHSPSNMEVPLYGTYSRVRTYVRTYYLGTRVYHLWYHLVETGTIMVPYWRYHIWYHIGSVDKLRITVHDVADQIPIKSHLRVWKRHDTHHHPRQAPPWYSSTIGRARAARLVSLSVHHLFGLVGVRGRFSAAAINHTRSGRAGPRLPFSSHQRRSSCCCWVAGNARRRLRPTMLHFFCITPRPYQQVVIGRPVGWTTGPPWLGRAGPGVAWPGQ